MSKEIFLLEVRDKMDKKYIFLIYIFQVLFLAIFHVMRFEKADYIQSFQGTQISGIFSFVCLMFLAYELFSDFQMREWRELLSLKRHGWKHTIITKDMLLLGFIGINFLVILCVEIIKLNVANYVDLLTLHVVKVIVLNYMLLPLVGVTFGKMCSLIAKKRWSGYLWLLGLTVLACGLFERINTALYLTLGINLDKVYALFQFKQPNSDWIVDILYLIPSEKYRFMLFAAWIIGCVAVMSVVLLKKQCIKIIASCLCFGLCAVVVLQVLNTNSYINYNMNSGAAGKKVEYENDVHVKEVVADFTIKKCSMNIHISDELYADVILKLDSNDLKKYLFTLYKGYEIIEITDNNGLPLAFERVNDFITVYSNESLSEVHMSYHGFNQSFYSNNQGVMLPGYFAYYPQAGHRQVFCDGVVDTITYYGYNTNINLLNPTYYEIAIEYDKGVQSNLTSVDGMYVGNTMAPTIMGGMVAKEYCDNFQVIYPKMCNISTDAMKGIKQSLILYGNTLGLDTTKYEKISTYILVPASVYIDNTWGENIIIGDCLFLQALNTDNINYDEIAIEVIKQDMNVYGDKSYIMQSMLDILSSAAYTDSLVPMKEEEFFAVSYEKNNLETEEYMNIIFDDSFGRMYVTLLYKFDQHTVYKRTVDYLLDDSCNDNCAQFMQKLYLELEGE